MGSEAPKDRLVLGPAPGLARWLLIGTLAGLALGVVLWLLFDNTSMIAALGGLGLAVGAAISSRENRADRA